MMRRVYANHGEFIEPHKLDWNLWLRWIFANTVGELIGLGVVAITGAAFVLYLSGRLGVWEHLVMALLMIAMGVFEGFVVGLSQARVLAAKVPYFRLNRWVEATVIGAVSAWILGTIPSFLMSFEEQAAGAPQPEFSELTMALLAAGMGLVLGVILAAPQWYELRHHVTKAGWWIPANAIAWAVGMPQLFAAPGVISEGIPVWQIGIVILGVIISAGASVGAIHGLFLIWLLNQERMNILKRDDM